MYWTGECMVATAQSMVEAAGYAIKHMPEYTGLDITIHDGPTSKKCYTVEDFTRHEVTSPSEVLSRVAGHEVVMNKEMPLTGDMIRAFPPEVKLIAEAGTGYNNIDLVAAREMDIDVCNVPTYATAAAGSSATLMLAYGVNDCEARLGFLPLERVAAALRPLTPGGRRCG